MEYIVINNHQLIHFNYWVMQLLILITYADVLFFPVKEIRALPMVH
jgi:hypothetical protein